MANNSSDGTGESSNEIRTDTRSHRFVACNKKLTCLINLPRFKVAPPTLFPLVTWRNTLEDWTPEDWSEDIGVSVYQT